MEKFKPLVIAGPVGVGKSSLINYLRFNHPEFRFIVPYTTRKVFEKTEQENVDFKKADDQMFADRNLDWFFVEEREEWMVEPHKVPASEVEATKQKVPTVVTKT